MRIAAALFFVSVALLAQCPADSPPSSPVGIYAELRDFVIPGPELEAAPLAPGSPVVLRILVARRHGDAFRYDIDYYGLESGEHDLGKYLQRKGGAGSETLPAIPVVFEAVLDPGRIIPNEPAARDTPRVGGYTLLLWIGGILWLAILLALIFCRRKKATALAATDAPPPSLADRLRPLVEAARDGDLDKAGQADLERTLLGFWREKLDLADESPATALAKLRRDSESAPLLQQLERWLHSPNPESPADIDALLDPYRNTAAS